MLPARLFSYEIAPSRTARLERAVPADGCLPSGAHPPSPLFLFMLRCRWWWYPPGVSRSSRAWPLPLRRRGRAAPSRRLFALLQQSAARVRHGPLSSPWIRRRQSRPAARGGRALRRRGRRTVLPASMGAAARGRAQTSASHGACDGNCIMYICLFRLVLVFSDFVCSCTRLGKNGFLPTLQGICCRRSLV